MTTRFLLSAAFALGLAAVHLFAQRLRFLHGIPRSIWLSAAGGASVAYIFVHVLPELSQGQETLQGGAIVATLAFLEHHVYLIALLGLVVFYGLERAAVRSKEERAPTPERAEEAAASPRVFWLHMASFTAYNLLIGYLLLHREEQGLPALSLFFIAMALHLLVNDYGLHDHHKQRYRQKGRWILSAAVLGGWLLGYFFQVGEAPLALLFAFLAGGIILNVLKEELPKERESRFWSFAAGGILYAALLLASG